MIIYKRDNKEHKAIEIRIFWTNPRENYTTYRSMKNEIISDIITLTHNVLIIDHCWDNGSLMGTKIIPIKNVKYISIVIPYIEPKH